MPRTYSPLQGAFWASFKIEHPAPMRTLVLASFGVLLLAAFAVPLAASTPLSDPNTPPFSDISFTPTPPQISPNGQWAVYLQDAVLDGVFELWSARVDGTGEPIRLTDPLWTSLQVVTFAISPNSARVVYKVAQNTCVVGTVPDCRIELFSIPIDGSAPPTQLNPPLSVNRNVTSFLISPTSTRVFYISDQVTDNVYQLYSVSITGGAAVRLNADLASDWDVEAYRVSPNGQTVVYRDERAALGYGNLWSVPATGSTAAVNINLPLPNFGAVGSYFQISPDSNRVVYRADTISDDSFNLYTVPIGGGSSNALNIGLAAGASVESGFLISDAGTNSRVVYLAAPLSQTPTYQLYSAPLAGGTPETRLNGTMGASQDVETGFALRFDGSKVVYRSDEGTNDMSELYAVPTAGGTRTKLNGALTANGDVLDFAISPDGNHVVYIADQATDALNELWSVPIVGGAAMKLNRTLAVGGDVQAFRISPNSSWVIYGADQDVDSVDEILGAPIGGGSVVDLNPPLGIDRDVSLTFTSTTLFQVSSNNVDVLYAADQVDDGKIELFKAVLGGPPSAPTGVVAVAGNTQVTVTFVPPTSDGGSPILGYAVTPSPATSGWSDSNAGSLLLTHVVTGLTNGTPYTFTVRATNATGTGLASMPSNSATPATFPSAPSAVAAVPRNQSADVTFAASASNGGSTITGYTVISNPAGGIDLNQGTTVLKHYVTGLTNGIPYTFTVVAQNGMGQSPASAPSAAVTPGCGVEVGTNVFCDGVESNDTSAWSAALTLPGAPTAVVAVASNAQATVTFVAPLFGGGSPITGYTVTPSPATIGWVDNNAGSTSLTHVITNLANGTAYTFTVRATNSSGQGPASAASNAVTPATVPGAPTAVFAVAGDSSATVTFVPPVADGGATITGYTVISDPPGGTDSNAGSTGLTHAITGLANGTEYTFTVTATNSAGTGDPSAPSNPVTPSPS